MMVFWSDRAKANFDSVLAYLKQRSPAGARRIRARIERSIRLLADFPSIAPPSRHAGLRQMVVPSTPYIVVYRINEDRVEIRAIIHAKQRRRS